MGLTKDQVLEIGVTEFEEQKDAVEVVKSLHAMSRETDLTKKSTDVYCPVIDSNCRMDCASWQRASIGSKKSADDSEKTIFVIIGHACASPMIKYRGSGGMF